MILRDDILIKANFYAALRRPEDMSIVPGSERVGHNILTNTGRNWISKLIGWSTIGGTDAPFTHRRIRWLSAGSGAYVESQSVTQLQSALLYSGSNYLAPITSVGFPTASSIRFTRIFATTELSTNPPTSVVITEAGLFADVSPWNAGGTEDAQEPSMTYPTTLNPTVATNPPVAYKSIEPITKTTDFLLEFRWDFRI